MFAQTFALFLVLAVACDAFRPLAAKASIFKTDLNMGNMIENFKFVKQFNRFTFKKFAGAIEAAGLVDMVNKEGITVFAPTDAAFEEFGDEAVAALMANKEQLIDTIKYHIHDGVLNKEPIVNDLKAVSTMHGNELKVDSDKTTAYLNDAKILTYDVEVDNGVFHIIDWVNVPKKA